MYIQGETIQHDGVNYNINNRNHNNDKNVQKMSSMFILNHMVLLGWQ